MITLRDVLLVLEQKDTLIDVRVRMARVLIKQMMAEQDAINLAADPAGLKSRTVLTPKEKYEPTTQN
jgi:hypothetical protein